MKIRGSLQNLMGDFLQPFTVFTGVNSRERQRTSVNKRQKPVAKAHSQTGLQIALSLSGQPLREGHLRQRSAVYSESLLGVPRSLSSGAVVENFLLSHKNLRRAK